MSVDSNQRPSLFSSSAVQVILFIAIIVGSFFLGSLWTKVQLLEKGGVTAGAAAAAPAGGQTGAAAAAPPAAGPTAGDLPKITDRDHVRGNRNAKVALVEYSDLECPFCKQFHPTAKKILETYGDKVMWVYRHFPLSFHANAQKEAEAAECAYDQGGDTAFWKYVDTIFERTTSNGTGFSLDNLVPLAKEIGLNDTTFKQCLDSGKFADYVKKDEDGGVKAGVTGTPGNIIVNVKTNATRLIPGALPFEQLKPSIDELLK